MQQGNLESALQWFQKSFDVLNEIERDAPDIPKRLRQRQKVHQGMAVCFWSLGVRLWEDGDLDAAGSRFQQARDVIQPLAKNISEIPGALRLYQEILLDWGQMLSRQGQLAHQAHHPAEAVAAIEQAMQIRRDLKASGSQQSGDASAWLNDGDGLNLQSELLAWACQERLDQLDIVKDDRTEILRLMQLGIASLKSLPESLQARPDLAELRDDLERRLKLIQYVQDRAKP